MTSIIVNTVKHSVISPEIKYVFDVFKIVSSLIICALIVFSAQLAIACDKAVNNREPAAVQSIRVVNSPSCDFNCSENTATSSELYACERLQLRCEFNGHLPLNTQKVGRN